MKKIRLGTQQKRILDLLEQHGNGTILGIAHILHGKPINPGGKEYNSICRSLHILEANGYVEKEGGQIHWHRKDKAQ